MKRLKINYTDGTSKEIAIRQINIANVPERVLHMHLNMMGRGNELTIDATSNLLPDLRFLKNMEFVESELPENIK